MSNHKRAVVKAAAALALFLLTCTVAARSVYTLLLPQVSTVQARNTELRTVDVYAGQFSGEGTGADVLAAGQVAFTVPAAALERVFSATASLECAFIAVSTGQPVEVRQCEAKLSPARVEAGQGGVYTVYADLDTAPEAPVAPGTPATVTVSAAGESSLCVPLSAVFYGADGPCVYQVLQRDTIWGAEFYVQAAPVEVLGSDAVNASVASLPGAVEGNLLDPNARFACYPSRTLVDGEAVRVDS